MTWFLVITIYLFGVALAYWSVAALARYFVMLDGRTFWNDNLNAVGWIFLPLSFMGCGMLMLVLMSSGRGFRSFAHPLWSWPWYNHSAR